MGHKISLAVDKTLNALAPPTTSNQQQHSPLRLAVPLQLVCGSSVGKYIKILEGAHVKVIKNNKKRRCNLLFFVVLLLFFVSLKPKPFFLLIS